MNAMEATQKLSQLNDRIKALDAAYKELWRDFDNRWIAVELNRIYTEMLEERNSLAEKLRAVQL